MLAGLWTVGNGNVVNTISNALSVPTLVGIGVALWHAYHGRCGRRGCFRPGAVPVEGTTKSLCCRHADRAGIVHGDT